MPFDETQIRNFLNEVMDPEVPVLSILDLGIVKNIFSNNEKTEITITPTYTGCPAMKVIEDDIKTKLREKGIENIHIKTVYAPAWTTDWISESGKEKLKKYGIAPPEKTSSDKSLLTGKEKKVACPRCHSLHTEMISQFGSTACKALYKCLDCLEPFDYFKCI